MDFDPEILRVLTEEGGFTAQQARAIAKAIDLSLERARQQQKLRGKRLALHGHNIAISEE